VPRYIGLDLHKMYIHGCEWIPTAPEKDKAKHFRFPNTQEGWTWLLNQVDRTCWVALEVTGSAFEAYDRLSPHVDRVLLANPRELKRLGARRHRDRVDAARLAKVLALDSLPTVWVPPLPMREVRRLLHYRDRLARARRRCINQAKRIFQRHGVLLSAHADVHHTAAHQDLSAIPAGDRAILASTLRQMNGLEAEIHAIESEIAVRVHPIPQVRQLLTITNVGMVGAATMWASLGDPQRFTHAKQVGRYAGLDPSFVQSGEELRRGRISKNGNTLLRTILVEVALGLARRDHGPLGHFYRRKKAQIGHKKAVIALARKLLIVAWRMLLTGEAYRAIKPAAVARKYRDLQRLTQQMPSLPTIAELAIAQSHVNYTRLRHARTPVPA
jgi:transposase